MRVCFQISGSSDDPAVQRWCNAGSDHDKGAEHGGCECDKLVAVLGVHLKFLFEVRPADQASWVDTEVMAGAMLVPMVMKAHAIAANTEANWVRVESVILKFLILAFRDVPVMSMRLHEPCQQCEIS